MLQDNWTQIITLLTDVMTKFLSLGWQGRRVNLDLASFVSV